jgi:hypothetical protein
LACLSTEAVTVVHSLASRPQPAAAQPRLLICFAATLLLLLLR